MATRKRKTQPGGRVVFAVVIFFGLIALGNSDLDLPIPPAFGGDGGAEECETRERLSGYTLPAREGKTGNEEPINTRGQVPSTSARVTFAQFANDGEAFREYYITMRWNYAEWGWDGRATIVDEEQMDWMGDKPRLVVVTNHRAERSIIAAALESGPAPWAGVDTYSNNNPKQGWVNRQSGTPDNYTGRVSGFPPTAIEALRARQGMYDGSGDVLEYGWAVNQNATPGPIDYCG